MAKYQVHFQTKDKNVITGWKTYEASSFEEAENLWNEEHRFDREKQLMFVRQVSDDEA